MAATAAQAEETPAAETRAAETRAEETRAAATGAREQATGARIGAGAEIASGIAAFPAAVALEAPVHSAVAPADTAAATREAVVHAGPPAWVDPAAAGAAGAAEAGGDE